MVGVAGVVAGGLLGGGSISSGVSGVFGDEASCGTGKQQGGGGGRVLLERRGEGGKGSKGGEPPPPLPNGTISMRNCKNAPH